MKHRFSRIIAEQLAIGSSQVDSVLELVEAGATVPFIARYRKEVTGSLDEMAIASIRDRQQQLQTLEKRRQAILDSLRELEVLSPELEKRIGAAQALSELEDLYLPYRPKRRTKATIARDQGLEPLARLIYRQQDRTSPDTVARAYVDPEKGVPDSSRALAGARDIIAEWVSEDAAARSKLRTLFQHQALIQSQVVSGKSEQDTRYRDYHDWSEPAGKAPSHRILALFRGEKEGFLRVRVRPSDDESVQQLERLFIHTDGEAAEQVRAAIRDGYRRLIRPSLETEMRQELKAGADREAIRIFGENLRHLLMAPPLGPKRTLAIDPGFRTGCKLVCLDPRGQLRHWETIYPHSGTGKARQAGTRISELCRDHCIEAIAIGNGTAGRETLSFIKGLQLPANVTQLLVDERGASIYSASAVARDEFPDHDITVRGAVSIGRRLLDPLAELVKIEPKSIGVGQYQHDVDQKQLKAALDDVVMSCVNAVGVEVNTASPQLLAYVSGLSPMLAKNIVSFRRQQGPFLNRRQLLKVPRLGPKAFEQAAGFLRIVDAADPLDRSAVHPESYPVVEAMARDLECTLPELVRIRDLAQRIDLSRYVTAEIGLPTLHDILAELAKPGRDPRDSFEEFSFTTGVDSIVDLQPGMSLPGIVTNVTAFGAFVDIGVHRDGLVHVSELADRFVSDPGRVVRVSQKVRVTVLEVDEKRHRISLSMKPGRQSSAHTSAGKQIHDQQTGSGTNTTTSRSNRNKRGNKRGAFNKPFEQLRRER